MPIAVGFSSRTQTIRICCEIVVKLLRKYSKVLELGSKLCSNCLFG
jgi:hypothetical protein